MCICVPVCLHECVFVHVCVHTCACMSECVSMCLGGRMRSLPAGVRKSCHCETSDHF